MLNTDAFVLLGGNPAVWDTETLQRCGAQGAENLCRVQEDQHDRGRRSAELCRSIYGWYVRSGSSLDGGCILAATRERGGELDGSRDAAIAWGVAWANEDPDNREFYASKNDLAEPDGFIVEEWAEETK